MELFSLARPDRNFKHTDSLVLPEHSMVLRRGQHGVQIGRPLGPVTYISHALASRSLADGGERAAFLAAGTRGGGVSDIPVGSETVNDQFGRTGWVFDC